MHVATELQDMHVAAELQDMRKGERMVNMLTCTYAWSPLQHFLFAALLPRAALSGSRHCSVVSGPPRPSVDDFFAIQWTAPSATFECNWALCKPIVLEAPSSVPLLRIRDTYGGWVSVATWYQKSTHSLEMLSHTCCTLSHLQYAEYIRCNGARYLSCVPIACY